MMNETEEHPGGSFVSVLRELNLPHLLGGPAGKAISKLVAGAVDIPAAYLEGFAQRARDNNTARSLISNDLAKAASARVISDPEIVDRAAIRWMGDQVRKQVNREEVARAALEDLKERPIDDDAQPVDDDWMDNFSAYAEKANSQKMRDLWARVLAGQIRKSGSYSLATLRFMAELDEETAQAAQRIFKGVFRGSAIYWQPKFNAGQDLVDVTLLEQRGLLSGVGGTRNVHPKIESNGLLILPFRRKTILVSGKPDTQISIDAMILSRMGAEVFSLISLDDEIETAKTMLSSLQVEGVQKVSWADYWIKDGRWHASVDGEILWERPSEE